MSWLEWVIIAWLVAAALFGWRAGFVFTFGSLVGFGASLWAARMWGATVAGFLGGGPWSQVIASIGIVLVVTKLGGLAATILNKIFKITTIIPFLGLINRLGGIVLSVATHVLLSSLVVFLVTRIILAPLATQWWSKQLVFLGGMVAGLLPSAVKHLL